MFGSKHKTAANHRDHSFTSEENIFNKRMYYEVGFKQRVKKRDFARYLMRYGKEIDFIVEKPGIIGKLRGEKPRTIKRPLVDVNLGYGVVEVSVFQHKTHKSKNEREIPQYEDIKVDYGVNRSDQPRRILAYESNTVDEVNEELDN